MKEQWKVGEIIELGAYRQQRNEKKEPIQWKILKITGEKAFAVSCCALDAQPYQADAAQPKAEAPQPDGNGQINLSALFPPGFQEATWEKSTLRAWLTRDFFSAAFSAEDQECLLDADELKDKVTLLTLDENINDASLFPTDASTGCVATPYAASLYTDDIEAERQASATRPLPPRASYWLKNKGIVIHGDQMEGVMGVTCGRFDLAGKLAVRPVILLNLDKYEALLSKKNQKTGLLARLIKKSDPIVHRLDTAEKKGTIQVDIQNRKIIAEGIGSPDLRLELPIQASLDQSNQQAIVMCLTMAITGDAKAQNSIGTLFWTGDVLVQDYRQAFVWNRYAANQGLPDAMVDLADAYFNAKGVEKDEQKAFEYCLRAAEKGFPLGMLNAGKCYAFGWGTQQDGAAAYEWLEKAAEAGVEEARQMIANATSNDEGE